MRTGFKAQEADSLWKNYLPELVPFETSLARITRYISKVCQCSPLALTLIASFIKKRSAWLDISVHKSVHGRINAKMFKNVNNEEIQILGVGG